MALLDLFDLFRYTRNKKGPPMEGRDGKEFRKRLRTKADEIYGVLESFTPSTYSSTVVGPNYTQIQKVYAIELAKISLQLEDVRNDHVFATTRSEFLFQNIAYLLFLHQRISLANFNDVEFRQFLQAIIRIFFRGSTPENIVEGIKLFLGEDANVKIRENYLDARTPGSGFDISDQFGFRLDFEITDEIARNFVDVFAKVLALITIIKPAHTLFQLRAIFTENFNAPVAVQDTFTFDWFDYFYDDVRRYCAGAYGRDRLGRKEQKCLDDEDVTDQFPDETPDQIEGSAFLDSYASLLAECVPVQLGETQLNVYGVLSAFAESDSLCYLLTESGEIITTESGIPIEIECDVFVFDDLLTEAGETISTESGDSLELE